MYKLIEGHFCESKIGPNMVFDAEFNAAFDFANCLTVSLLLRFEFMSSQMASWKS